MSDVQTGGLLLPLQDVLFPFAAAIEGDPWARGPSAPRPPGPRCLPRPGFLVCLASLQTDLRILGPSNREMQKTKPEAPTITPV